MYAVAHTSLFDMITNIEFVDADSPEHALMQIEALRPYFLDEETLDVEQMIRVLFDGDMLVGIEKVPS